MEGDPIWVGLRLPVPSGQVYCISSVGGPHVSSYIIWTSPFTSLQVGRLRPQITTGCLRICPYRYDVKLFVFFCLFYSNFVIRLYLKSCLVLSYLDFSFCLWQVGGLWPQITTGYLRIYPYIVVYYTSCIFSFILFKLILSSDHIWSHGTNKKVRDEGDWRCLCRVF